MTKPSEGQVTGRCNTEELRRLELAPRTEFRGLIDLLEHRQGHYQFADDQVLFETEEDLGQYDAQMDKINPLIGQQDALRNQLQKKALSDLEKARQ